MVERNKAPETYRDTTIGLSLEQSLDELVNSGEINELTKQSILQSFDLAVLEKFSELKSTRPTKLSGHSDDYKNVEDIWRFKLDKLEIRDDYTFRENSDGCVIVSQTSSNNPKEPDEKN